MEGAGSSKNRKRKKNQKEKKPSTGPIFENRRMYSKTPGFADSAGQEYEIHLCALVFLRARNSGLKFQLGTNVNGAGALDDLVFRCKTREEAPSDWTTMYVQLKHKETSNIKRKMLTSEKGDFSLQKYFQSYLEIKEAMLSKKETLLDGSFEDSQFVIFTNANGNNDWVEWQAGDLSLVEKFVWFGSGKIFSFETDEEILKLLGECVEGGKFLTQLRLFCGQPNLHRLNEAVKDELLQLDTEIIRAVNIDRLCNCYLGNVKFWCESKYKGKIGGNTVYSDILDNDHDILLTAIDKVRLESCSEQTLQTFRLELEFEEAGLPLPGAGLSVVQCSGGSWRLSLTKLVQASQGRCLALTCQQLSDNKRGLLAEWRKGDVKCLIVCTQDWRSELANQCFEVIVQMLSLRDGCSVWDIVFLQDGNSSVGSKLTSEFQGRCQSFSDHFKMSQLADESKYKIFDKTVNLQGYNTTLLELFNKDCSGASQVLDASLVAAIMEIDGPLIVGPDLPEGIGYFVERTLSWACVKTSVFHEFQGTVTIRLTQREATTRTLLEKAIDFVCSLKDHPSFSQGNKVNVIDKLNRSVLVPDKDDGEVYVGPKFLLGFCECNCIGLRFSQDNALTALRVCPSNDASVKTSFLFVPDDGDFENDVRKLSEFYNSKHLLALKDGKIRWIQSQESVEFVQPHFDEDNFLEKTPETATNVEEKLVLVCAEPGMGKSTLMAQLAKNTKAALPHYFVILLSLNDLTKLFADGEHKDMLGFLSNASSMHSPLQRALLKHALEVSGNIVIIADGFDEISPRYVNECSQLLSRFLGKTKANKIWMTSRNSVKQKLESQFFQFSAKLCKFDVNAQREFLKKFWAGKSSLSENGLDKFINQLLQKTFQAVRDKEKDFMGIPLQMQILAEVYEGCVSGAAEKPELPINLDLLKLLELFVDKKFKVYVEVKLFVKYHYATYEMSYEMYKEKFIDSHSKAALSLLLDDDDLKTLGMEWVIKDSLEFCETISSGKDKTGFIVNVVNGKPRFTHRVFAEYFVAKWISEHLADNAELIRSKLFTADFGVVRTIIDRILSRNYLLHTAVLSEDLEQVRTLVDSQVELVNVKDDGGRTALHLAAGLGTSEDQEENARRGKILGLLIEKSSNFHSVDDVLGSSPLRYADITQWWVAIDKLLRKSDTSEQLLLTSANVTDEGMLETIFALDLDRLLGFCLDHGLAVEHRSENRGRLMLRACEKGSLNVASLLIDRNADINHIMFDIQSPLQSASIAGHLAIVKLLYGKHAVNNADATNISTTSDYTNMKDMHGITAMHHAAKYSQVEIISFLISQGGDTTSRDFRNRMPLYSAAKSNQPLALRLLLEAVDDDDQNDVVNSCDNDGHNVLYYAAKKGSVECVQLLVHAGAKLSLVGCDGKTSLMAAASKGKNEVVESLLHNLSEEKEGLSKQDLIIMEDKDGQTAMHHAAKSGSLKCLELLVQAGAKVSQVSRDGETALIAAASSGNQEVVEWLLSNFNEEKEGISRLDFFNMRDKNGNTAMYHRALLDSVEFVGLLVQAGVKLSQMNLNGETPLMAAALQGNQEVVKWLCCNFNEERDGMSHRDFIFKADKYGNTAIHYASMVGSVECVELLFQAGASLFHSNRDRKTPLMAAASKAERGVVEWLLHNFNEDREGMSLLDFLNTQDKEGKTAVYYAVKRGSLECVELLVQAGASVSLLSGNGESVLMISSRRGMQEVVKCLLQNFNEEREGIVRLEFINKEDEDGHNAMYHAALRGSVECVELLILTGAKLSQVGRDGKTPLMAAAMQGRQAVVRCLLHNFNAEVEGKSQLDFIYMKDMDGRTAIHQPAMVGSVQCVELLVKAGVKLSQVGIDGETLLMTAALRGNQEVVEWLLNNFNAENEGLSQLGFVSILDDDDHSALYYAAKGGSVKCVELLVNAGINLSQVGSDRVTSLMAAASKGRRKVVDWMLHNFNEDKEGISHEDFINEKDKNGHTALYYASQGGSVECVGLIVNASMKLSQISHNGETPLMAAARMDEPEIVECLLHHFNAERKGVDLLDLINIKDKNGNTALHYAAKSRSVECLELLVQAGAKLSQVTCNGVTPLMAAANQSNYYIVEWLLHNFNPEREHMSQVDFINMKDKNCWTAIHYAAKREFVECVEILVQAGGTLSQVNRNGETPLMVAARKGNQEVVEWMVYNVNAEREGVSQLEFVNMLDKDGNSAMHHPALLYSLESVELLIQAGAKVSQGSIDGVTPLMTAARLGEHEVVECLLHNFDADIEGVSQEDFIHVKDKVGRTAIHFAVNEDSVECVELLVQAGARLSEVSHDGKTSLMAAAKRSADEVLEWVLHNFNADKEGMSRLEFINLKDSDGKTAIYYAAQWASLECVELLYLAGANLSQVGGDGKTLLMAAVINKDHEIVKYLLHNFDPEKECMTHLNFINVKDKDGQTAMHHAVKVGSVECGKLLVQAGANLSLENDNGESPLMIAALRGMVEVLECLLHNFEEKREGFSLLEYFHKRDKDGKTVLHHAALLNELDGIVQTISLINNEDVDFDSLMRENNFPGVVRVLLEAVDEADRADIVNSCDNNGDSVLMCGALGGFVEVVQLLVQAGGKLSQVNRLGVTPFMAAAMQGKRDVMECLLHNFNSKREAMNQIEFINMKDKTGRTAMHYASRYGDLDIIRFLISQGSDATSHDFHESTSLHLAAELQHPAVVKVLLEAVDEADRAAEVSKCDNDGCSVLMCAAAGGSLECVDLLVQAGARLSQIDCEGMTSLMAAAWRGKQDVVEYLLFNFNSEREAMNQFEFINMKDKTGRTAMHYASEYGDLDIIRFLISQGGDAKCRDFHNSTPLHLSAETQHPAVVRVLLEAVDEADRAAEVSMCDNDGDSVLMCGALGGSVECVKLLAKTGAKLSQVNLNGETTLMAAAKKGKQEVVEYLLHNFHEKGEGMSHMDFINMRDNYGNTALSHAARFGDPNAINFLISHGGDVQCRNSHNSTPLHLAAEYQHPTAVRVLLEAVDEADRAAAVNMCDSDGDSVLMCGALGGSVECVKLLSEAGAKLSQVSSNGETSLMVAAINGKREVVKCLLHNFHEKREGMHLMNFINMRDEDGFTAMLYATLSVSVECLELLVKAGAKFSLVNCNGETSLMVAASNGSREVVEWLLHNFSAEGEGISLVDFINMQDEDGFTAMVYATLRDSVECLELLVQAGAMLSHQGRDGVTPLMAAAWKGKQEVVEWILLKFNEVREGMSQAEYINTKDKNGWTAMHHSQENGHLDVISFMISQSGDAKSRYLHNEPLHLVAVPDYPGVFTVLLEAVDEADRTAVVNPSDNDVEPIIQSHPNLFQVCRYGEAPLMAAAISKGDQEVEEWLECNSNKEREGVSQLDLIDMAYKKRVTACDKAVREVDNLCDKILLKLSAEPKRPKCKVKFEGIPAISSKLITKK